MIKIESIRDWIETDKKTIHSVKSADFGNQL